MREYYTHCNLLTIVRRPRKGTMASKLNATIAYFDKTLDPSGDDFASVFDLVHAIKPQWKREDINIKVGHLTILLSTYECLST